MHSVSTPKAMQKENCDGRWQADGCVPQKPKRCGLHGGKRPNRALGKNKTPLSTTPGRLKYDAAKNRRVIAVAVSQQEAEPPAFAQAWPEAQRLGRHPSPDTPGRTSAPFPSWHPSCWR